MAAAGRVRRATSAVCHAVRRAVPVLAGVAALALAPPAADALGGRPVGAFLPLAAVAILAVLARRLPRPVRAGRPGTSRARAARPVSGGARHRQPDSGPHRAPGWHADLRGRRARGPASD